VFMILPPSYLNKTAWEIKSSNSTTNANIALEKGD